MCEIQFNKNHNEKDYQSEKREIYHFAINESLLWERLKTAQKNI